MINYFWRNDKNSKPIQKDHESVLPSAGSVPDVELTAGLEKTSWVKINSGNRSQIIISGFLAFASLFFSWKVGFVFSLDGTQLGMVIPMVLTFFYPVRRAWVRGYLSPLVGKTVCILGGLFFLSVTTGLANHKIFIFEKNAIGPGAWIYLGALVLLMRGVWAYCKVQPKLEPFYKKIIRFLLAKKTVMVIFLVVIFAFVYMHMRVLTVVPSTAGAERYSALQYFPERGHFFEVGQSSCLVDSQSKSRQECLGSIDDGMVGKWTILRFPYFGFLHAVSVPVQ